MNIVFEHFRNRLEELGYPTEDIEFSLSYAQGDGMAFYGDLYNDDVRNVAKRLLPSSSAIFEAFERADKDEILFESHIAIQRNDLGYRYAHAGTMTVWGEVNIDYLQDSVSEADIKKYYKAFQDLTETIQEDVRHVSRMLASEGYALQESCDPLWFAGLENNIWIEKHIGRFTVQVQMRKPPFDFSLYEVSTDFDGNPITPEQVANSLISKQTCAYSLSAQVFNSQTHCPIGKPVFEEVIYDARDLKLGRKVARELVSQAIENARAELERLTVRPVKGQRIA